MTADRTAAALDRLDRFVRNYDPNQPRAADGEWAKAAGWGSKGYDAAAHLQDGAKWVDGHEGRYYHLDGYVYEKRPKGHKDSWKADTEVGELHAVAHKLPAPPGGTQPKPPPAATAQTPAAAQHAPTSTKKSGVSDGHALAVAAMLRVSYKDSDLKPGFKPKKTLVNLVHQQLKADLPGAPTAEDAKAHIARAVELVAAGKAGPHPSTQRGAYHYEGSDFTPWYASGTHPDKAAPQPTVVAGHGVGEKIHSMTGGKVSKEALAAACGAVPGAAVNMTATPTGVNVNITHKDYRAKRIVQQNDDGSVSLYNDEIHATTTGQGVGTRVFAQQVKAAHEAGFKDLKCMAAGWKGNPVMNGYYSWARLGYDAALTADDTKKLPAPLSSAKRVSDLMKTAAGREWWKDNGTGRQMVFDLTPGSLSRRVLDAYAAAKGIV